VSRVSVINVFVASIWLLRIAFNSAISTIHLAMSCSGASWL